MWPSLPQERLPGGRSYPVCVTDNTVAAGLLPTGPRTPECWRSSPRVTPVQKHRGQTWWQKTCRGAAVLTVHFCPWACDLCFRVFQSQDTSVCPELRSCAASLPSRSSSHWGYLKAESFRMKLDFCQLSLIEESFWCVY